jgi:hypothetical protein
MQRKAYRWGASTAGVLLCSAVASATVAHAAGIGWEARGALQACLDTEVQGWINTRAALVANDDPAAGDIDDAAVAAWAMQALKGCAGKVGGAADAASEQRFMKYMAHWREHIYSAADEFRTRARPD